MSRRFVPMTGYPNDCGNCLLPRRAHFESGACLITGKASVPAAAEAGAAWAMAVLRRQAGVE